MEKSSQRRRLPVEKLRWTCDPATLPLDVHSGNNRSLEIIGQERALDALRMGLDIRKTGYHIFVTGTEGTGRTTTIRRVLEDRSTKVELEDLCYVFNFDDFDSPLLLRFPSGEGRDFKNRLGRMVASLRRHVPTLYKSESYQKRLNRLERGFRQLQEEAGRQFSDKASKLGFQIVEMQSGAYSHPDLVVGMGDEQLEINELSNLVERGDITEKQRSALVNAYESLSEELKSVIRANTRLDEELQREARRLEQSVVRPLIRDGIEILRKKFEGEIVQRYLEQVEEALLEESWVTREGEDADLQEPFFRYFVNLIVDNARQHTSPVIIENQPGFTQLFGNIERKTLPNGVSFFDYRQIKAGSIARAQGGTLVIMARDLLDEPTVWPALKRVLRSEKLEIQGYDTQNRQTLGGLKPEAIELDVKVILVGDSELYHLLLQGDPDLQRVFRIKADFETDMPRTKSNLRRYVSFIRKVQKKDGLLPVTPPGLAALVEFGVRLAGRKNRLSTRFSKLVDVLIESDYMARKAKAKSIGVEHIDAALDNRKRRYGAAEQHMQEAFRDGTMLLDTSGMMVGQVNGLFVLEQWDHHFGQPMRMTATVSPGEGELLSLEREVELSGASFDKGHMILEGFLRQRFAQTRPLSLSASLSCEQNYVPVDGDSATTTETFALLSALGRIPLRQSIAMTGSVNQFGQVQAIGAVNEKIEGFFKICHDRGLTGEQGVIIPASNESRLMLSKEVIEAARKGQFQVWAISHIDEGMEILSGLPAGKLRKDGTWTPGSVNALVDERLEELAAIQKDASK